MLWKIFGATFLGIYLMLIVVDAFDDGLVEAVRKIGLLPVWLIIGMLVFTSFGYAVYALIMGGKYSVLFEMDEKGVRHTQCPKQFKRAAAIGRAGAIIGAARGNPGMVGQGLVTSSRQSMSTGFAGVKKIIPLKRRGIIKLNETLMHNQVYAKKEDFDAVLAYIVQRCPRAKIGGKAARGANRRS